MISIVSGVSLHVHKEDIRDDFAKSFLNEVCEKAGVEVSRYKNLDSDIERSKNFDITVKQILDKYRFDDQTYDCEKTEAKTNEDFVKSLNI